MYLALLEFNCISGFGVPIGLSLLYVLWRSFIPKWLDIFKDYCEKLLNKFDLREVVNKIELQRENYSLISIIKDIYHLKFGFNPDNIEYIKLNKENIIDIKNFIASHFCYIYYENNKKYYKSMSFYDSEEISEFFFILERYKRSHILIYKSKDGLLNLLNSELYKMCKDEKLNFEHIINNSFNSSVISSVITYDKSTNAIKLIEKGNKP